MGSQLPGGEIESPTASAVGLEEAIHSLAAEVLCRAAGDPSLAQDLALTLLNRTDLPPECLIALSKNPTVSKYRRVRAAIVEHARTPRHVSIPMLRLLYTFDLMQVAVTPVVAADIKRAAEEVLRAKLETISVGEKLTLARRAGGRIAAELLLDKVSRVMQAALENPRLTEASVARAVISVKAPASLAEMVCHHPRWLLARDVRIALLRSDKTPLARALEIAQSLSPKLLREVLQNSRLPESTKACLLRQCNTSLKMPKRVKPLRRS
jgi:hypothetical protein